MFLCYLSLWGPVVKGEAVMLGQEEDKDISINAIHGTFLIYEFVEKEN